MFTLHFCLYTGPTADLRAVGNNPAPTMALHAELLPMDENELTAKVVPPEYHNFFNVFSHEETKLMPPHHLYDHTIDLEDDQMPPHSHIYPLSGTELSTLHKFLNNMLGKGFIHLSSSPRGRPFLFTKKKDGTLWLHRLSEPEPHYLKKSLPDPACHQSNRPARISEDLHQVRRLLGPTPPPARIFPCSSTGLSTS